MDLKIEQISKAIQKNFNQLSNELDIKDLLRELFEQSLICIFDYETLISKTRIERNYDFFMNIDMHGEAVGKEFLLWLEKTNNALFLKTSTTQTKEICCDLNDYDEVVKEQLCIKKQFVLLLRRMNANAIAPQLFEDEYFDRDDLESILILPTRKQRANQLLTLLVGRLKTSYIKLGVLSSFTRALAMFQPELCNEFMTRTFSSTQNNNKALNQQNMPAHV